MVLLCTDGPASTVAVEVQHPAVVDNHVQGQDLTQGRANDLIGEELSPWFMEGFMWPKVMVTKGKLVSPEN